MKAVLILIVALALMLTFAYVVIWLAKWSSSADTPKVTKREKALDALNDDASYLFSRMLNPTNLADMDILTEETRIKIQEWRNKNRKLKP